MDRQMKKWGALKTPLPTLEKSRLFPPFKHKVGREKSHFHPCLFQSYFAEGMKECIDDSDGGASLEKE